MQESLSLSAALRRGSGGASGGLRLRQGLFLVGALLLIQGWGCSPGGNQAPKDAPRVPDFSLERLAGGSPVSRATLQGQIVVLDFWATWCVPCERQVPALNAFAAAHASDPDVHVYGVSADLDGPEVVQEWVTEKGVAYPILLGGDELAQDLGAPGFPVTYVLDGQGRIRARHVGVIEASDLEKNLANLRSEDG